VRMAVKTSFWIAIRSVVASQMPDYESLVSAARKEHIRAIHWVSTWKSGISKSPHFSRDVAKLVTQPLWPSRVPRCMSCSAMVRVDRLARNKRVWRDCVDLVEFLFTESTWHELILEIVESPNRDIAKTQTPRFQLFHSNLSESL
jgi:hypothetical protein